MQQHPPYNPTFMDPTFAVEQAPGFIPSVQFAPAPPPLAAAPPIYIPTAAVHMTDDEAKAVLNREVAEHPTWQKSAVTNFLITDIQSSWAFLYVLESFKESRTVMTLTEPYLYGMPVDGPAYGNPPGLWELQMAPSALFVNATLHSRIPHTESVSNCASCRGSGKSSCCHCQGRGSNFCSTCAGSGLKPEPRPSPPPLSDHMDDIMHRHQHQPPQCQPQPPCHTPQWCPSCNGRKTVQCCKCSGSGLLTCSKCMGSGQVKIYQQLCANFETKTSDYIDTVCEIPDQEVRCRQLKEGFGPTTFREQASMLTPVQNHPRAVINDYSSGLIRDHTAWAANGVLLQQRHSIRAIPVFEVTYQYAGNPIDKFWIYGEQRKVHIASYPAKCCCGCSIL